jgi:hypothetical protein
MNDVPGNATLRLKDPVTLSQHRELVSNSTNYVGMDEGVKAVRTKRKRPATSVDDSGLVLQLDR